MCLFPILIENANYNRFSRSSYFSKYKDTTSRYIYRPCGVCSQCLELRQVYFIQRAQMETFDNDLFFCTLTYNRKYLPVIDINGYKIKYPRYHDIRLFMQALRNKNVFGSDFKYCCVSEYGKKDKSHRPHWHILFSVPKIPNESFALKLYREKNLYWKVLECWSENIGTRKQPVYDRRLDLVYRNGRSTYDFHYVNPSLTSDGELDVAFYITKYTLKINDYTKKLKSALYFNCGDKFSYYWNLVRPRILTSKYFGSPKSSAVIKHINKGIQLAIDACSPYPYFINPLSGKTFPLAPYYRDIFITEDMMSSFLANSDHELLTDYDLMQATKEELTIYEKEQREKRFRNKVSKIVARDLYYDSSDDNICINPNLNQFQDEFSRDFFKDPSASTCWTDSVFDCYHFDSDH